MSWRALFVVPLAMPVAAVLITRGSVRETTRTAGRHPDVPGAAAALVALGAFSVGLIAGPTDWTAPLPIAGLIVAAAATAGFVAIELRRTDPMLPLGFFRRRAFVGGNVVWLLGSMTCWAAVFFVAISVQTTLGDRPLAAGLVIMPIYLVMMVGSPLAGRIAQRVGHRAPILLGLGGYSAGLWMLSGIGPDSTLLGGVVPGVLLLAVGMAAFTAPLVAATFGALDRADQGVASGVNNAMGQLASLLAIAVLPAAAGLSGVALSDPAFAAGHTAAMRIGTGLGVVAVLVAAITVARRPAPERPTSGPTTDHRGSIGVTVPSRSSRAAAASRQRSSR